MRVTKRARVARRARRLHPAGHMSARPKEEEKWGSYGDTVLEFGGPPMLAIDLRRSLEARTRDAIRALGLVEPFAVLTAENPNGENPEDAPSGRAAEARAQRNERRMSRLEQELRRGDVAFAAVDGTAPDGSYRERCVAAMMPQAAAVALAKRLDQLALFWYDGETFWLLPADTDAEPERLPRGEAPE